MKYTTCPPVKARGRRALFAAVAAVCCSLLGGFPGRVSAAWRPGLLAGFHDEGNAQAMPLVYETVAPDTFAATNWSRDNLGRELFCDRGVPVVTNGDGTAVSVWSETRLWRYSGQIRLPAGSVTFGGEIDDIVVLDVDGERILQTTPCARQTASRDYAEEGWHDFSLTLVNELSSGGPANGTGLDDTGFGFAIKENGAAEWTYPADDGTMSRYRFDDGTGFADELVVAGDPCEPSGAEPPFGESRGHSAGETIRCSAPASFVENGSRGTLVEYVVRTNFHARAEYAHGTNACFDLVFPGDLTFVDWIYDAEHEISFETSGSGQISEATGWRPHGSELTVTASGGDFVSWAGDLPADVDPASPTLTFVVDRPRAIRAEFRTASFTGKLYTGPQQGSWDDPANWTPAGIPTMSDAVAVPAGAKVIVPNSLFAGSLAISNGAVVSVGAATTERHERLKFSKNFAAGKAYGDYGRRATPSLAAPVTVKVASDAVLHADAQLLVGGQFQAVHSTVEIDGSLDLAAGSFLDVYAGAEPGFVDEDSSGGDVTVGVGTHLRSGSTVTLFNHLGEALEGSNEKNGTSAPVFLELGDAVIEEGAAIVAYAGMTAQTPPHAAWSSSCGTAYVGGSHGGRGGGGGSKNSAPPYNPGPALCDKLLAPVLPGPYGRDANTCGGGTIRILARSLVLDGTLDASPRTLVNDWEAGGAAGGSVMVACDTLSLGERFLLKARGQDAPLYSAHHNCGGGGGGRVAIAVGLDSEQIGQVVRTGAADGITLPEDLAALKPANVDVAGGAPAYLGQRGGDGTAVLYRKQREGYVSLSVKTTDLAGATLDDTISPPLGMNAVQKGSAVTATAPQYAFLGDDTRFELTGYRVEDAGGATIASGTGCSVDLGPVDSDMTLVWLFGKPDYRVEVETSGGGSASGGGWYGAGDDATLSATPGPGASFRAWLTPGFPREGRFSAPRVTITVFSPLKAVACFSGAAAPAAKTWSGPAGGSWDDPANWTPAGVPGHSDAVVIPGGATVDLPTYGVAASLELAPGATLSVFGKTTDEITPSLELCENHKLAAGRIARDDTPSPAIAGFAAAGDIVLRQGARLTVGGFNQLRPSAVLAGGTLRVAADASLQIYAGPTNSINVTTRTGGAVVDAAGAIVLEDGATLTALGHLVTNDHATDGRASATTLYAGAFHLAEGARLVSNAGANSWALGIPTRNIDKTGGGHGGKGGGIGSGKDGGPAFDEPFAPLLPGSPGRAICNIGGGALRVHAVTALLAGEIDVSATLFSSNGYEQGGAAGGSIWITASGLSVRPTARLVARGQDARMLNGQSSHVCGGGGGGRVAIGKNLSAEDIDALYATGAPARAFMRKTDLVASPEAFRGTIDVGPGAGVNGGEDGGTGTAWFLDATSPGTMLFLR